MSREEDLKRYLDAKMRAASRKTTQSELRIDCLGGFEMGMGLVHSQVPEFARSITRNLHPEMNYSFGVIAGVLAKLEAVKGKHYAASWMKRGELVGAKANLDRKFDRLEVLMGHDEEAAKGENITQTLGDLAVYTMKWLTLRAEIAPKEVADWMEEIRRL